MIIANDSRDIKDRFDRMRERLRDHQPVLVGHNMFTDLVYLYRTFVGPLPDTLSGFCETIHEMFPRIVDTKYLATHAGGDLNASPPLQEIAEKLEKQPLPTIGEFFVCVMRVGVLIVDIETAAGYDKYKNKEAYHEAGFDSLLTATIMLRLAAKLGADGQEKSALPPKSEPGPSQSSRAEASKRSDNQAARSSTATVLPVKVTSTPTRDKNKKGKQAAKKPSAASRFQTRNLFESLRLNDDPASAVREPSSSSSSDSGEYHTPPDTPWQDEVYQPDTSSWVPLETRERLPMEIIPPFDSEFWTQFGNTLRVYGTEETVLRIADWKANTS
jgi:poly(A)-specific ribonuclease